MPGPLCFVLMPFGLKTDSRGVVIDFDTIYRDAILPAVSDAGMEAIRADEEQTGGSIHKPMFERLVLCDYAVADLTTANANVFYELGVRHALRPASTVLIRAAHSRLPFDVAPLRALSYDLSSGGVAADPQATRKVLAERLRDARGGSTDSPVFQLVDGVRPAEIAHIKTDVFRDRAAYSARVKQALTEARRSGPAAVQAVEASLGPLDDVEAGVLVDLFLSYRATSAWEQMVRLAQAMPAPLANSVMIREQHALALNRLNRGDPQAEALLRQLIDERGDSAETWGLLGRVYKDRWEVMLVEGDELTAQGELDKAIDAYYRGFTADWRDAYPGINAATLMELADPPDPRRHQILPVVRFANDQRLAARPAYWDHATAVELAALVDDEQAAVAAARKALAQMREGWEGQTTARNLQLIRQARERRGKPLAWLAPLEDALRQRGARLDGQTGTQAAPAPA